MYNIKPDMIEHTCDSYTTKVETGGSDVRRPA